MKTRRPWQRLALSLIGISVIMITWVWATAYLYTLPERSISAFQAITVNSFYVVGAIVIFMVTGRLIYEMKGSFTSTATTVSEAISNKIEYATRTPRPRDFSLEEDYEDQNA